MFRGSIVALVTPFKDGKIDDAKIKELVQFHLDHGTNGILPCGTTGESPTLSHDEHKRVVELCIEVAGGKVPILAGTGSNSTSEAVALTKHAARAGADAALVVTPYYNKPMQEGLYQHFKAIADNVDIPIILYNIVGRTARNIETETVVRLANDCKNIIGVKEASGSLDQMQAVKLYCPEGFILLSGDDALTLPLLSIGGQGVVSVVANIIPDQTAKLVNLFDAGRIEEARTLHFKMLPLVKAMFLETNPIPVKTAMGLLGLCDDTLRLPLTSMSDSDKVKLQSAIKAYGLVEKTLV
ncbi:MAG: 4-hydroxy-tetrahydrodipicolinate synthase [Candidatus Omnitrophica bacterium]|nr:4-hydroxy-tetrahydrodipicolinate synthase [Candidatus Omnitrophota bacterium]